MHISDREWDTTSVRHKKEASKGINNGRQLQLKESSSEECLCGARFQAGRSQGYGGWDHSQMTIASNAGYYESQATLEALAMKGWDGGTSPPS